jgi:hypothetical protein
MVFLRPEDVSIEQCRGIESIDLNISMVLVKAPIELVSQAFSQLKQAEIWMRGVYEHEVKFIGQSVMVFQLREHPWTVIYRFCKPPYDSDLPYPVGATAEDAQNLSNLLNTRVIYYTASDTSGTINYHLYQDGISIERLFFEEESYIEFESQLRQLEAKDIENAYSFTLNFIREQDAYIPALFVLECPNLDERIILRLENLNLSDLERMDYIAYR